MIDNDIPGLPKSETRTKKPLKAIRSRLKGKEGRLRGNLMGKRVDFSARTVIGGDPNLDIDQVGIPRSVAMTLTYPEIVTPININRIQELVRNGPDIHPGAKYIIREDGSKIDLRFSSGLFLKPGYRVERHMHDGDLVIFNRQPSLHKMSMMGHRAKILPFSTFRVNLSVTPPYNADFDGDEMNLHLAQSNESRAEIKHLMMVPRQIVSPQGNRPCMGIVQDSLLGIFMFTRRDNFMKVDIVMQLLMWLPEWDGEIPKPAILKPEQLWTGKQLISLLLQPCPVTFVKNSAIARKEKQDKDFPWNPPGDSKVIIYNGEHLCGVMDKGSVGARSGSIIHLVWLEHGTEKAKYFLSITQRLIGMWLLSTGFTVGCSDILPSQEVVEEVASIISKSKKEVRSLVQKAQKGQLETQPGKTMLESFEASVNKELNAAREVSGEQASGSLNNVDNNILTMVDSGSKGSSINVAQIIACVGQQNVEGKRIPFGFRGRTLPCFRKDDYGPESRGFVENSYLAGLTPQEMFFHAMGGREGIIDTACKTSETGYIQRRLIKAMEDVMVKYDLTVRNSCGDVIQFLYGEDGISGEYVEDQRMVLLNVSWHDMSERYKHDFTRSDWGSWIKDPKVRWTIKNNLVLQASLDDEFEKLGRCKDTLAGYTYTDGNDSQHIPVNVDRMIELAKIKFTNDQFTDFSPVDIAQEVDELLDNKLRVVTGDLKDQISQSAQFNATIVISAHLRTALNSKKIQKSDMLGKQAFTWLIGQIASQFRRSLAHPGESVGAIAAQSIGEPATQMTLNTFHFAGVGSKNVTLGVPRLREIINVAKSPRTPSLTVYLLSHIATIPTDEGEKKKVEELVNSVKSKLQFSNLYSCTLYTEIIYDPEKENTVVEEDVDWVNEYYQIPEEGESNTALSSFVLRIVLDKTQLVATDLSIQEVAKKIREEFSDQLNVIQTDDNADIPVLRIRLVHHPEDEDDDDSSESPIAQLKSIEHRLLQTLALKGCPGIKKVFMRVSKRTLYNSADGTFFTHNEWVLDTDGCNLRAALAIEEVDVVRTISNDLCEVIDVLGIEAVRRALLNELRAVISFDGSYVNYRHLSILCDVMCQRGDLMPITRHGINRVDKGPFVKASFEETVEILFESAIHGDMDHLTGVSENVMLGNLGPFGTGDFDVYIDFDSLKDCSFPQGGDGDNTSADLDANTLMSGFQESNPFSAPVELDYTLPTPYFSPDNMMSPDLMTAEDKTSPLCSPAMITSPSSFNSSMGSSTRSPVYASPGYTFSTPAYESRPGGYKRAGKGGPNSFGSSVSSPVYNPQSPGGPGSSGSIVSPKHRFQSPSYHPDSTKNFSPTSPNYSPTSPNYTPGSPTYTPSMNPTSRRKSPGVASSPAYMAPTSAGYSPTSPGYDLSAQPKPITGRYSAMSPSYSPTSPGYDPTSPMGAPTSPGMNISSPGMRSPGGLFSPLSPSSRYDPKSPLSAPVSPRYRGAPVSPGYRGVPMSPGYAPMSPGYIPSAARNISSPAYTLGKGVPIGEVVDPMINPYSPVIAPDTNAMEEDDDED
eukprot:GHVL01035461.1.p1 GENE.GHVL01035461.1~~GHVL01035461.1.p1  ORF type:complete len:1739 (+),score=319.01 GHVL01035461.1:582-5219(+)